MLSESFKIVHKCFFHFDYGFPTSGSFKTKGQFVNDGEPQVSDVFEENGLRPQSEVIYKVSGCNCSENLKET